MKTKSIFGFNLAFAIVVALVTAGPVLPQEPAPAAPAPESPEQEPVFGIEVQEIMVPVTVTKSDGQFAIDLKSSDFRVLDEDKAQTPLGFQLSEGPLSIAVLVETSSRVESLLTQISRAGLSFTQLVMGETGEAAVIAFDTDVKLVQDFTENPDLIENSLKGLKPGGKDVRLSDAIWQAISLLQRRPNGRRKVIVAISEARDNGSSNTPSFVLLDAQHRGISIYALTLSTATGMFDRVGKGTHRPFPTGVAALPVPDKYAPTPDTQTRFGAANANLLPFFEEMVSSPKNLVATNPLMFLAQGTGAEEFSTAGNAMGQALSRIGRELRSQYLITYRPNTDKPGFHHIRVLVDQSDLLVRALPGYVFGRPTARSPESSTAPAANRHPEK